MQIQRNNINTSLRIQSIDIMRGLTLFLMLFVNDLYEPGVPYWLVHAKGNVDAMGLADWVFPGFLFMVGMSVPYALASRKKKGDSHAKILLHIFLRTISLLLIGFFVMNGEEYFSAQLAGMNRFLWLLLVYISVFLIWNYYSANRKYAKLYTGLKLLGILGLIVLAYFFKSGKEGAESWMHTGWWGILGLIGWGYFVAALCYFFIKDKLLPTIIAWLFFVALNILSLAGHLHFLDFLRPVFGILIDGNVPSIVLAGMILGIFLKRKIVVNLYKLCLTIFVFGIVYLIAGFLLRHWFIISKIQGTPSWAMICNGISMMVFALLYFIIDIKARTAGLSMFREAGKNSLTTYLAPDIVYFITWLLHIPLYLYKQNHNALLAVLGSLIWAFVMIWFAIFLSKIKIKLKL